MNYSVGFQLYEKGEEPFSNIVEDYKEHISEVFFAWQDIPTGRSAVASRHGYTDWDTGRRTVEELRRIRSMGIKSDLLFNGNCYGEYALSEKLANSVVSAIEYLDSETGGVDIVTTASIAIAHTVRKYFPDIELRSSVNMRIGTVKGMEYVSDLFDSFHVQKEYNRDIERLKTLKEWADENGKKLIILANSGCLYNCSGQIFHDNLVAHESEICEIKNLDDLMPYVCWRYLKDKDNWHTVLENTWIRPEDIHNYEGITDTVKLATRMHSLPAIVIDAYCKESFFGNTLDLFEPSFSRALAPYIINNAAFPEDWFTITSKCDRICNRCGYCKTVFDKVVFNTEDN